MYLIAGLILHSQGGLSTGEILGGGLSQIFGWTLSGSGFAGLRLSEL